MGDAVDNYHIALCFFCKQKLALLLRKLDSPIEDVVIEHCLGGIFNGAVETEHGVSGEYNFLNAVAPNIGKYRVYCLRCSAWIVHQPCHYGYTCLPGGL